MSTKANTRFRPGVLFGEEVTELLNYANEKDFALPAVNVINTSTINAVLETASAVNSPVIIQFSNGGAAFYAAGFCGAAQAGRAHPAVYEVALS